MKNQQPLSDTNKEISLQADEDVHAPHNNFTQDETFVNEQIEEDSPTDTALNGDRTSHEATETSSSQDQTFTDTVKETKSALQMTSSQIAKLETVRDDGEVKAIQAESDTAVGMQLVHLDP